MTHRIPSAEPFIGAFRHYLSRDGTNGGWSYDTCSCGMNLNTTDEWETHKREEERILAETRNDRELERLRKEDKKLRRQLKDNEQVTMEYNQAMTTYKVYLISKDGQGMVQQLEDWDGSDTLTLHLDAFASDAVIEIQPEYHNDQDEES